MICQNTPIERYEIDGGEIFVKREDLACLPPGPPFAKVRGLYSRLLKLKSKGVEVVGYTETSISMAGWGISWMAHELGIKAVIFNPVYAKENDTSSVLEYHRSKWKEFDAETIDIDAGMAKVNYYVGKKILLEKFGPKAVMLPLGIPFPETVHAVSDEFILSSCGKFKSIVVCVGSGTMAAGILSGIIETKSDAKLYGVLCRESNQPGFKRSLLFDKAGIVFNNSFRNFHLVDLGYEYTNKVEMDCPFPCNPYYDAKAYKFLLDCRKEGYNKNRFKEPILFWNIGA